MAVRDINAPGLQGQVTDVVDQGKEIVAHEASFLAKDAFWYASTFGTIAVSLGLFLTGRVKAANFVGLWAPTLLCLGLLRRIDKDLNAYHG